MSRAAALVVIAVATTACHSPNQAPSPAANMLTCASNRAMGAGFEALPMGSLRNATLVRRAGDGTIEDVLEVTVTDSTLSVKAGVWLKNGPPPEAGVMQLAAQIQHDCTP
jgi:hypothetical protein